MLHGDYQDGQQGEGATKCDAGGQRRCREDYVEVPLARRRRTASPILQPTARQADAEHSDAPATTWQRVTGTRHILQLVKEVVTNHEL